MPSETSVLFAQKSEMSWAVAVFPFDSAEFLAGISAPPNHWHPRLRSRRLSYFVKCVDAYVLDGPAEPA